MRREGGVVWKKEIELNLLREFRNVFFMKEINGGTGRWFRVFNVDYNSKMLLFCFGFEGVEIDEGFRLE